MKTEFSLFAPLCRTNLSGNWHSLVMRDEQINNPP